LSWIDSLGEQERELQKILRRVVSPTPSLLHLDYHQLNVLSNGSRIVGVIDWPNAQIGDPRADVARTYSMLAIEPYVPGTQGVRLALLRRIIVAGWRRGYEQIRGRLTDMAPFHAWAGLYLQRSLAHRVTDPSSWWRPEHMMKIRRWTDGWKRRSGL
jgi:aminoglycoside phosphotransferase (APT) family kinase protein